jgi:ribosomal protein L34
MTIRKTTKGKGRNYLSVKEGAGMTATGRKAYNAKTGSNLKAPTKDKTSPRHKSFCARSASWNGERGLAARKRWGC